MMKSLIFIIAGSLFFSCLAQADEVSDLQGLGSNKALIKRAQKLDPKSRYRIVQRRLVDRNTRLEVSLGGNMVAGGDAYYNTINVGAQIDFHINPNWAIGARYYKSNNTLTNEGQRVHDQAEEDFNAGLTSQVPDIDAPDSTILGTITYAPIYGKLNFFNLKTVQFDVYTLVGAGTINLTESGNTLAYTAGVGTGVWFNNTVTARFEIKYLGYEDSLNSPEGSRQMNTINAGLTIGFLL